VPPRPDRRRGSGERGERDAAKKAVVRGRKPPRTGKAEPTEPPKPLPKQWGGVARRGARVVGEPRPGSASEAWREAVARGRQDEERHSGPPPAWEPEVWIEEARPATNGARRRPPPARDDRASRSRRLPEDVSREVARATGPGHSAKVEQTLAEAAKAYERDRYQDARRLLKPLAERMPDAAAVRELHGLTLYRMGRWKEAIRELEAFRILTGSYDQHPVLADCHRALRHWKRGAELWEELRVASPGAELVAEGRIVAAGALADRGDVRGAIALLERARTDGKRPKLHHVRVWYALADLYERAGEIPRARELFKRVLAYDREFADTAERLAGLA
jgi:tetratricopeptide (TPR) repeat protein